jgi:hypothetical protein
MRALNAEAKLFVPGRGLVTPEKPRRASTLDRSTNPFVSKDDDDAFVGRTTEDAVTPREGDASPDAFASESPLSLASDEEALELDASTLSPATATTEWVRFDADGFGAEDAAEEEEDVDDARRAMEVIDASLTRPLLKSSSSSSGRVEVYGAIAESPTLEDGGEAREPLMTPRAMERATSYGAVEEAIVENSPQIVVELDVIEDAVTERVVSEAAMGSGAGEPLLAAAAGGGAYGASGDGESPKAWQAMRVPLLPETKETTYGAASPVRAPKDGGVRGRVYRVKELKTPPTPVDVAAPSAKEEEAETARMDKAAQAPLLGKASVSATNLANYGAVDKAVEETARAGGTSDDEDLRRFLRDNAAPYELFEEEYEEPVRYDRDEEMLDIEDDCDEDEDDRPAPSAPPLAGSFDISRDRALVDDLCCIMWTVARERLELLQPLFRSQGSSIGRITLAQLRRLVQKLEPRRANPRALDRLEAMLCACGYSEDVSLSEFVHATHAGTVAATRLSTASGAHEASVLCGHLDELMSRTPASAQTALMLGGSLHKAWLDLPRLLAKNLEPQQLCLLVATLDLADDLTMKIKGAKLHEYQAWLRWMQNMLNTVPSPREPLDVSPQPQPAPAPATKPKPELSEEEMGIRRAKRDRLVALWEARDALRRASTTSSF